MPGREEGGNVLWGCLAEKEGDKVLWVCMAEKEGVKVPVTEPSGGVWQRRGGLSPMGVPGREVRD